MSNTPAKGSKPFKSTLGSIEQLRDRVAHAVSEILRLREANKELAARIARLESPQKTVITFDDEPEVLQDKLTGFIDAIDQFLEQEDASAD